MIVQLSAQFDQPVLVRHAPTGTRDQFIVSVAIRRLGAHPIDAVPEALLPSIHIPQVEQIRSVFPVLV